MLSGGSTATGRGSALIAAATAAPTSAVGTTGDVMRELLDLRALVIGLKQKVAELETRNKVAQAD